MKKVLPITFGLLANLFAFTQCPVIVTDTQVSCEGYIWTDGNSYNSSNYFPLTTIGEQTPILFSTTTNQTWTNVYTSCVIGDGNNGEEQTIVINVIEMPENGTNYRVVKTMANGNFFNGNAQPLVLGLNTINVAPPINPWGDRTVKFQFDSDDVKFSMLSSNGNTVYESTTQTLTNQSGCDTLIILDLIFDGNPASSTEVISACNSYTWSNGITYTESNYIASTTIEAQTPNLFTIANVPDTSSWTNVYTACTIGDGNNGAQQTLEINITSLPTEGANYRVVKSVSNGNFNIGEAQPLLLGNNNINVNAVENPWGDRIVKFQFSSNTVEFDEISLNGNLDYSGIPSQVLTTNAGCDSTVILDLSFYSNSSVTDLIEACDSYTWIDGNTYTSSNNTATHTLINSVGCDSIITLNLTINESNTGTDTQTAVDSYVWIDGITYTMSNNTATYILTNNNNCDSVVFLNLTIKNSSFIDVNKNNEIKLFPNPSSDKITIELEGIEAMDVSLLNSQGKILLQKSGQFDEYDINLTSYTAGIYFLRIITSEGNKNIRFIKQ